MPIRFIVHLTPEVGPEILGGIKVYGIAKTRFTLGMDVARGTDVPYVPLTFNEVTRTLTAHVLIARPSSVQAAATITYAVTSLHMPTLILGGYGRTEEWISVLHLGSGIVQLGKTNDREEVMTFLSAPVKQGKLIAFEGGSKELLERQLYMSPFIEGPSSIKIFPADGSRMIEDYKKETVCDQIFDVEMVDSVTAAAAIAINAATSRSQLLWGLYKKGKNYAVSRYFASGVAQQLADLEHYEIAMVLIQSEQVFFETLRMPRPDVSVYFFDERERDEIKMAFTAITGKFPEKWIRVDVLREGELAEPIEIDRRLRVALAEFPGMTVPEQSREMKIFVSAVI